MDQPIQSGYVPASYLKIRPDDPRITDPSEAEEEMLGFVSSLALPLADIDPALKYVAIDTYNSEDPRQLCFPEGATIVVVEKSEDGQWPCLYLCFVIQA